MTIEAKPFGPDIIVIDDPHADGHEPTPEDRERHLAWFKEQLSKAREIPPVIILAKEYRPQ